MTGAALQIMPPIRVLHIVQNLNYGGMERLIADLVRHVDSRLFESHVLCLQYSGRFAREVENPARLHVAPRQTVLSMVRPTSLSRQLRRIAPQVVHSHSGVWYKAARAARVAGVQRVIHTDHGRSRPMSPADRLIERLASLRTDVVIAVSDSVASQLTQAGIVDAKRLRTIRNGVDTNLHVRRGDDLILRRQLGLPADVPIIGSIGRLEPVKAYDQMLQAFALLRAGWIDGPPPVLVIAGDGTERSRLDRSVAALGLGGAAHLIGWRDDVHSLHSAFAMFTMSSSSEGTSVSLLESMSAGLCPVVTAVGGNPAILGPALRHRLVAASDPAALARAWRVTLADAARRAEDAGHARARVLASFSLASMVSDYEHLYMTAGRS